MKYKYRRISFWVSNLVFWSWPNISFTNFTIFINWVGIPEISIYYLLLTKRVCLTIVYCVIWRNKVEVTTLETRQLKSKLCTAIVSNAVIHLVKFGSLFEKVALSRGVFARLNFDTFFLAESELSQICNLFGVLFRTTIFTTTESGNFQPYVSEIDQNQPVT